MNRNTRRLLLPALLALTAAAPAAPAGRKAPVKEPAKAAAPARESAALTEVKYLEYADEIVAYPATWQAGPKTRTLQTIALYYQWDKPGRTCSKDTYPWAHVVIGTDVAPCWPPDKEFYTQVKKQAVAGVTGTLYRRKPPAADEVSSPDNCPTHSNMLLVFNKNKRCYTIKFLTAEKWLKQVFPDYNLIMNNFRSGDQD